MRGFKQPRPNEAALIRARVAAALANKPNLSPRELADQTGLPLGLAIAELESRGAQS